MVAAELVRGHGVLKVFPIVSDIEMKTVIERDRHTVDQRWTKLAQVQTVSARYYHFFESSDYEISRAHRSNFLL